MSYKYASLKELDLAFLNHRQLARKSQFPQRYGIRELPNGQMVAHTRPYPESWLTASRVSGFWRQIQLQYRS